MAGVVVTLKDVIVKPDGKNKMCGNNLIMAWIFGLPIISGFVIMVVCTIDYLVWLRKRGSDVK